MKINHRIATSADDPIWSDIESAGIPIDKSSEMWVAKFTEDHAAWPDIEPLLDGFATHFVTNSFTTTELNAEDWLLLLSQGHHGYPEPDIDCPTVTDDLSDYCPICGIGGVQIAPFRLQTEPKASRSQFIQLNWVFDEYFLRQSARDGLSAAGITGIGFLTPVLHKSGRPSERLTQMTIQTVLPPALDVTNLRTVTCKEGNEERKTGHPQIAVFVLCV